MGQNYKTVPRKYDQMATLVLLPKKQFNLPIVAHLSELIHLQKILFFSQFGYASEKKKPFIQ